MVTVVPAVAEERLSSERADAERDELIAELVQALLVVGLALAAGGGQEATAPVSALTELLLWGHGMASAPARWANSTLLRRVSELLTEAAVNTSLTGCISPSLAEAGLRWLLLHLSSPGVAPDRCVTALFHAADLLEAVSCRPGADAADELRAVCCADLPRLLGGAVGQLLRLTADGQQPLPAQLAEISSLLRSLLTGWRRLEQQGETPQRDMAALLLSAAQQRVIQEKLQVSSGDVSAG